MLLMSLMQQASVCNNCLLTLYFKAYHCFIDALPEPVRCWQLPLNCSTVATVALSEVR